MAPSWAYDRWMTNKLLNSDAALQWSELFFVLWTIEALLTRYKAKDFSSFSFILVHAR